jgi:hypothetical protein
LKVERQRLSLESAGKGGVTVAHGTTRAVKLLSAATGIEAGPELKQQTENLFFRYRNHVCTPAFRVNGLELANRGGSIRKGKESMNFGGARGACLTGTVPAYGAAFIAQNWCKCSPGQIPGLMAVASIGKMPTPEQMEQPTQAIALGSYGAADNIESKAKWSTFRGSQTRGSSVDCKVPAEVAAGWTAKTGALESKGNLSHDYRAYLNSPLTAASLTDDLALVGSLDTNEVIALNRKDGSLAWRRALASRVDSPPTIAGGLCLVGDHSGYVTALNVKTGEPVYRLRIAPEEKRMMSYGKIESVWPVIGGVLVDGDRAYASAGRTRGSDGGLVVRCFDVKTGKHHWAKAVPQSGHGVTGRPHRNDCVMIEGDVVRLMEQRMNPKTGEYAKSPVGEALAAEIKKIEKETGKKPDRKTTQALERKLRAKHQAAMIGLEGLYSWNWTRLGDRKFGSIGFGGKTGLAAAWNENYAATHDRAGNLRVLALKPPAEGEKPLPNYARRLDAKEQVTSIVLTDNAVVLAGLKEVDDTVKGFVIGIPLDPTARPQLQENWRQEFDVPVAFNGLAADDGEVFVSLNDGRVVQLKEAE